MKVLFLTNNSDVAMSLSDWLAGHGCCVRVWDGALSPDNLVSDMPEWVVSYNYRHIIKSHILSLLPGRVINLHVSLLPWNRGADPNLWSFIDDTPKGVSIHHIDAGLDTGPLIVQRKMDFDPVAETLETSYVKLHAEIQGLFRENWDMLLAGRLPGRQQPSGGSFHTLKDSASLKRLLGPDYLKISCAELARRFAELKGRGTCK